ncbi:hypothetical protein CRYUN_Cryun18bG0035100 [Craigia yunnanensis]
MKTEGKKSLQDAARKDDDKEQNNEFPPSEDIYIKENETGLASINLEGVKEPHDDIQRQAEKEQDNNTIPEAEEKSLQEAAYADEAKGQDHLVPAAEGINTHGNEKELASSEHVGIASPHVENWKQDEKEKDNSKNLVGAKKKSLQEAASTNEIKAQAHLIPAAEDKNTYEIEPGLVSRNPDGVAFPCVDNQKQDKKEEDSNLNNKVNEKSSQETASTDLEREDQLLPAVEDKNTHGKETGLVSRDPEGTADPHGENPKQDEKGEDNMDAEPLAKDDHADDNEEKNLTIPATEGEDCNNAEAELASGDPTVVADTLDNQTLEGKDININNKVNEKSSQETASTDVERADQLLPAVKDKNTHGKKTGLVSSDPEGTAEPHGENPKQDEKEEDNMDAEPLAKDDHADDNEEKNLTIPATEGEDCNNAEAELVSGDPTVVADTLDNQTLEGKEDEGTRNSISDAASSTSHGSVPQEPAVLVPEEHELSKIYTEQLVQVCNGPLISENRIIPSLTCPDQEKGFILDSSISTYMIERDFPDPSLEVEKERDDFSVKQMSTKEERIEEKFELKDEDEDEDEAANIFGNVTTIITDLPNSLGSKCNGKLPSEMNSINDSPESQVEAILSDETQNFLLEVSKTEDKGIVLSQNATLVREESENGNSNHSHCQIQSGEEPIEKSNGMGSEEGSKADDPNASPPQFMMNGHPNEEKRCLLDISCDSKSYNDCQFEEPKIVENSHLVDASINYQNEATEEQEKNSQKEVHSVADPAVIFEDTFLTDQKYKEEESEEKNIIQEMVEKMEDSNPIGNDTSRRENGEQCISRSYPTEQAEAFLRPPPFLHALPEKHQQDSHMECKKVQNSESLAELKQESSGEFSTSETSSIVTKNLTEKTLVSVGELAGENPLGDLSQCQKPTPVTMVETKPSLKRFSEQRTIGETSAIANGDYYQRESVGRLSTESNPDNMSIHAQMRKSPSFDLDLRIDARAEESDQTPLLFLDKTTIESFSSQADVTDLEKPVANTDYGNNSLEYEAMPVEDKVVTLERSDSEKSKTPFLGFLREEEEADQMLITPKKQDNQSAAKKATEVSAMEVASASTKGKEKRKPRTSLFGSCMCCATVIN